MGPNSWNQAQPAGVMVKRSTTVGILQERRVGGTWPPSNYNPRLNRSTRQRRAPVNLLNVFARSPAHP